MKSFWTTRRKVAVALFILGAALLATGLFFLLQDLGHI